MKIQNALTAVALSSATLLAMACAPANPQVGAPLETFETDAQQAPVSTRVAFKPEVDILFVIDNSDSMAKHQDTLKRNIDRFVESFERNKKIDFHIGVTSIYDSSRYGKTTKFGFFVPIPHALGALYPLKDGSAAPQAVVGQPAPLAPNFVTRVPGYNKILGETLKIGTIPRGTDLKDLGGPEVEELFTPVAAAINGQNVGFIRPEAHLAVILISDADDISNVSPSKLKQLLVSSKNNDPTMISTFAVMPMGNCERDAGFKNKPIVAVPEFLRMTNGQAYNLCDPKYGDKLAEAGRLIEQATSQKIRIDLDGIPQDGTLKVRIAATGQDVPFLYDSHDYTVTISSEVMENQAADAQVEVTYTPIAVGRIGTGRVKNSTPGTN